MLPGEPRSIRKRRGPCSCKSPRCPGQERALRSAPVVVVFWERKTRPTLGTDAYKEGRPGSHPSEAGAARAPEGDLFLADCRAIRRWPYLPGKPHSVHFGKKSSNNGPARADPINKRPATIRSQWVSVCFYPLRCANS